MYYCTRCHCWHKSKDLIKKHRIFASQNKILRAKARKLTNHSNNVYTKPLKHKTHKKSRVLVHKPVIRTHMPTLMITHKEKQQKKNKEDYSPLRKANVGYSKRRRGQLAMRPKDSYERQMVQRITRQSGMTHLQVMHLVNKARDSDFDIEHGIDWNLSKDPLETYEFASSQLDAGIDPLKKKTMRDLGAEAEMYGF